MRYWCKWVIFIRNLSGLYILKLATKLATIKISTSSLLFTQKWIYFGFFLQSCYVLMLKYLTGQTLVLTLVHHWNSHGPYSACSNVWVFWFLVLIFFSNFCFCFFFCGFCYSVVILLPFGKFSFSGDSCYIQSTHLLHTTLQPQWITSQDRPVSFCPFLLLILSISGKRMVSVVCTICCLQSADDPLWEEAMSHALLRSVAESGCDTEQTHPLSFTVICAIPLFIELNVLIKDLCSC